MLALTQEQVELNWFPIAHDYKDFTEVGSSGLRIVEDTVVIINDRDYNTEEEVTGQQELQARLDTFREGQTEATQQ